MSVQLLKKYTEYKINVATYHLGKVKLELASGLSPLQYMTYRAALRELQGSLCVILLVLHCTVALLADRSASIFAVLQIIADSCSLSLLPACLVVS